MRLYGHVAAFMPSAPEMPPYDSKKGAFGEFESPLTDCATPGHVSSCGKAALVCWRENAIGSLWQTITLIAEKYHI